MMACMECNLSFVGPRIQRNFGFMFTFTGRTLFLIFCGTMALAMGNALGYVMGAATFLNGIFNGYVILVHPAFRTGELSASSDPYGGYTGGEAEIGDFLKRNPEMATKAVTFAASNPELAKAAVSAAQQPAAAPKANPWGSSA